MRFRDKSQRPDRRSGTGPIVVMGYPTRTPISRTLAAGQKMGCISGSNGQSYPAWPVGGDQQPALELRGYDGRSARDLRHHGVW